MNTPAVDSSPGSKDRFAFGKNWRQFLTVLNDDRIALAEKSVQTLLQSNDLTGLRLLDIGSGSGLFSLAARRLGATVSSFDYDQDSVGCTSELRRRYFDADEGWTVQQGSVLDKDFLRTLGQFDVLYSWGVLHHTGDMWQAFENVVPLVAPGGKLAISIYNDQGSWSRRWRLIKRIYNSLPGFLKPLFSLLILAPRELKYLLLDSIRLRPWAYFANIRHYSSHSLRGMSYWYDLKDWIGGYPFEVAKPEQIFDFFFERGFILQHMTTVAGGHGCNEFVFQVQ
jgi:2-polyprenyl-3-methyl-5-hydroxy-6-metoxy-1,4-benzoquinol methylase